MRLENRFSLLSLSSSPNHVSTSPPRQPSSLPSSKPPRPNKSTSRKTPTSKSKQQQQSSNKYPTNKAKSNNYLRWNYPPPGPTELITTLPQACKAVNYLKSQQIIAVDFEGVELSRTGQLCLLQAASISKIFIFDIIILGKSVFNTRKENGAGLGALLEGRVLKVVHDSRHDCDSLLSQFGVRMTNIWDTQVAFRMLKRQQEVSTEPLPISLKTLLLKFTGLKEEDCQVKVAGKERMQDDKGFWKTRPLNEEALKYARFDVEHLLKVHNTLRKYLERENYERVREESEIYANMFRDDEDGPRKAQERFDELVKKARADQERWKDFQELPMKNFMFVRFRILQCLRFDYKDEKR